VVAIIIHAAPVAEFWNASCKLPYGLQIKDIKRAVLDTYDLLYTINQALTDHGYPFLEHILLGNTFSGMLSELLVKHIATKSTTLNRNNWVGGHPDLIPRGKYPNDAVLRGEGIEVKTSRQPGGWQAHNIEKMWVMVFRYTMGDPTDPAEPERSCRPDP